MPVKEEPILRTLSFEELKELIINDDCQCLKAAFELDGFDVNMTNAKGKTALHKAVRKDKTEILELLTSHPQIDLNIKDKKLMTPLMEAAEKGSVRSLKLLLEKGADVSCCDSLGLGALWYASINDNSECFETLLRSKKCIFSTKKTIFYHFLYIKPAIEPIKKLIIETSDPYYVNIFGFTILRYGCATKSLDTVKLIVETGILNINIRAEESKSTPLHAALLSSALDIADYLIQKGAKLVIKNSRGQSAYDYAAEYDDSETFLEKYEPEERFLSKMFQVLVEKSRFKTLRAYAEKCVTGKYPNGPKILSKAIYFALEHEYQASLEFLLSQITSKDFIIKSALKATTVWRCKCFGSVYERYLELEMDEAQMKETRTKLFLSAMNERNLLVCDYLLENGVDPNEIVYGCSHLITACELENAEVAESLLKFGANVNCHNRLGESALTYAVTIDYLELVQILIKYGADPKAKDGLGDTALFPAAWHGWTELFFYLFELDKETLNHKLSCDRTLFLAACNSGKLEIIKALVEAGACIKDVDIDNHNCLYYAAIRNFNCETMVYLLDILGKETFDEMIIAVDIEGDRPVDIIVREYDNETIANLLLAIPHLADLMDIQPCIRTQNPNQEMCLICRDDFMTVVDAIILPCKHMYHEDCYGEWRKKKNNCPYCQRSIVSVKK